MFHIHTLFGGGERTSVFHVHLRFVRLIQRNIPNKKRNAPLRNVPLSGRSQVIGQFSLYDCKGISSAASSHVFCNLALKLC